MRGQVWTGKRVAEVIRRTFGLSSHPAPVSRRLHAIRHRVHPPTPRATQRNEPAIQAWWRERWPALEKSARRRAHGRRGRSVGLLFVAPRAAYGGTLWADARLAGAAHP